MEKIWIITKRELRAFFDSLIAYLFIIVFLAFTGYFTWLISDSNVLALKEASLARYFGIAYWTLFFLIPCITMGLISEENRSGTYELLITKPISDWQIIIGKYLAALLLIVFAVVLTLPYYISVSFLGKIDHSATINGFVGILLFSAFYISIGIFASSISKNQIVSLIISFIIGIFFQLIFGVLAFSSSGLTGTICNYLNIYSHFEAISRGVIDSKDFIYFFSVIFLGLAGAEIVVTRRNINS